MNSLVIYPTDTAQWYALVNEAEMSLNDVLGEEVESYLVFLLMRFAAKPEIAKSVLAIDFLESEQAAKHDRYQKLRDVGDKSLLLSGLFPLVAKRKRVTVSYFIDLGQTAYSRLANLVEESSKNMELFLELCQKFERLAHVLHAMRDVSQEHHLLIFPWAADIDEYKH